MHAALTTQPCYWHELVVVGVDPETAPKPYAGPSFTRMLSKIPFPFAAERRRGTFGLSGLVPLASLVASITSATSWTRSSAVAGVLGISIGAIQAALKNATQSLLGRLPADLYSDLVPDAVTSLPPLTRKGQRVSRGAKRSRTVTSPLPPRPMP